MLAAFAFCITALNLALVSGLGPPSLTAITISFPIRVKVLAIADQRFIFLAFLNSNALPISVNCLIVDLFNLIDRLYKSAKVSYSEKNQKRNFKLKLLLIKIIFYKTEF